MSAEASYFIEYVGEFDLRGRARRQVRRFVDHVLEVKEYENLTRVRVFMTRHPDTWGIRAMAKEPGRQPWPLFDLAGFPHAGLSEPEFMKARDSMASVPAPPLADYVASDPASRVKS